MDDKQNMIYTYNGILFSHKKEWNSDTYCLMNKPWKYDAKWKKMDTKGHMLEIYRI